jgi:hypothetical protein
VFRQITEEEFLEVVRGFRSSAFHFEEQRTYAIASEREDFERFIAGNPLPPPNSALWQPWLERVGRLKAEGKSIGRVRILEEPPTDYQRWLLWATPWAAAAGEDIRYMPRSRAEHIGLPLGHDWWLLDDERVLLTYFTFAGSIREKILTDKPGDVARYRIWRDLAIAHSEHAEQVAAA